MFFRPSLTSLLSSFTKLADKLQTHADAARDKASALVGKSMDISIAASSDHQGALVAADAAYTRALEVANTAFNAADIKAEALYARADGLYEEANKADRVAAKVAALLA